MSKLSPQFSPQLRDMLEIFGEDGVKEIVQAYLNSLSEFEAFLGNLQADALEIKKQAHKMKSPSLSVGEMEIAEFCTAIEKTGVISDVERASALRLIQNVREKLK